MKRIYWVSRHAPLISQIKELKRIFNDDVELVIDPKPFSSAKELAERYRNSDCSDIIVVAPLSVIQHLIDDEGIHPLWAEMEQVSDKSLSEVTVNGRYYRFVKFKRVKAVRLELEDL